MNIFGSSFIKFHEAVAFKNVLHTQLRFRRPNLKKPMTHFRREVVFRLTKPKHLKWYEGLSIDNLCSKAVNTKQKALQGEVIYPLDQLVANEIRDVIFDSKIVVVFHKHSCSSDEFYDLRYELNKIQLTHIKHTDTAIRLALRNTEYENMLRLYQASTITFVGPETKFSKLLKAQKKYPFVSLIGGLYEGRIISVSDFDRLAENSDIENYHGALSGLLSSPASRVTSSLSHHQRELQRSLTAYGDMLKSSS